MILGMWACYYCPHQQEKRKRKRERERKKIGTSLTETRAGILNPPSCWTTTNLLKTTSIVKPLPAFLQFNSQSSSQYLHHKS
ncbi:hypothetical protein I7I50_02501 [Histoplasma capsulatum G186AR]|uniref:Uncharacterized protein n=1 Tax=Ajellomyces capsulatus TaxID=5037 RepID=A0A8H8D619_AJECA|nr:hypothetical protein I7I52_00835 [Histoplasma capsulatum]QSS71599.1 hypothetical protein I7I50_02501 [Histoplasma capsulatum G186AR]